MTALPARPAPGYGTVAPPVGSAELVDGQLVPYRPADLVAPVVEGSVERLVVVPAVRVTRARPVVYRRQVQPVRQVDPLVWLRRRWRLALGLAVGDVVVLGGAGVWFGTTAVGAALAASVGAAVAVRVLAPVVGPALAVTRPVASTAAALLTLSFLHPSGCCCPCHR